MTQFSAMSVLGDTAIVKIVMPINAVWEKHHGIEIDQFNAILLKIVLEHVQVTTPLAIRLRTQERW